MIVAGINLLQTVSEYSTAGRQAENLLGPGHFWDFAKIHLMIDGPNPREVMSILFMILIGPVVLAVVCIFGKFESKPAPHNPNSLWKWLAGPNFLKPSLPPPSPKKPSKGEKDSGIIWYIIKNTIGL